MTAATVGRPIPSGFVGMSIELKALEEYTGTNPAAIDPAFVRLLQDIAPEQTPVLRVGGDSTDWSWWPTPHTRRPGGVRYTLTPNWMRVARALDTELHAKMILGVNLEADNRAIAAAEAHAMVDQIGAGNIEALELGNEPELYGTFSWYRSTTGQLIAGRPRGYDERDFISDYSSLAPTLPDVPLAGPSSGAPEWLAQLGAFLSDEPRVRLATVHAYPLKHCTKSKVVTSGELLADASSHGLAELIAPLVTVAAAHHVPLRIDELNGISCGGTRGVSDTFTSALWVLDTLFELARVGVGGVNIHTVPGAINEILGPQLARGTWQVRVHPEFYGMVMFAQAAPPGSHLLRVSSKVAPGVKVWATRTPSGAIHVIVINKRLRGPATLSLRIASAHGVAIAEQLLAPGVHATGGVTLGGQSFGSATTTGALAGAPSRIAISPSGGAYGVRLPAASATMLTLPAR
ncbi:MAG: glycosyl hydrolase family 79 C-terminal domain-containing protein [Solirubrobacteraceae bacterium]